MANIIGTSWGKTPGTLGDAGGVVTWSLGPAGSDVGIFSSTSGLSVSGQSFLNFDFTGVIRRAFADWSEHGNIEFMQIADGGGAAGTGMIADIRIFFGGIPGNTIGWAYYPTTEVSASAGDILLDNMVKFNSDRELFRGLVLHEIGHSIGLGHVSTRSIMMRTIQYDALQQDDINGIRQVYGAQDSARPKYDLPDDQSNLDILKSPAQIIVNGNSRNNVINGSNTSELIRGAGGQDTLLGRGGKDRLEGGGANDSLVGFGGQDTLVGGPGGDSLNGSEGRDDISGGTGNDRLRGGQGHDTLKGGDQHDTLEGLAGNDRLLGQGDSDEIRGGYGNDYAYGGSGGDNLRGNQGHDELRGGRGADTVFGNAGKDTLTGGPGEDLLQAGPGHDRVKGNGGDDQLIDGTGNDTMIGGKGSDVFVFTGNHGNDVIPDFNANNDLEKIDLRGVSGLSRFSDLKGPGAAATKQGADVLIDTGAGSSILLEDVKISDLRPSDFIF